MLISYDLISWQCGRTILFVVDANMQVLNQSCTRESVCVLAVTAMMFTGCKKTNAVKTWWATVFQWWSHVPTADGTHGESYSLYQRAAE